MCIRDREGDELPARVLRADPPQARVGPQPAPPLRHRAGPGLPLRALTRSDQAVGSCIAPERTTAITPPSTSRSVPVMNDADGPSRNAAASAMSDGVPIRPVPETSIIPCIICLLYTSDAAD